MIKRDVKSILGIDKHSILYTKIAIVLIVILKIVLMGLFTSDYQEKMFIPFVSSFVVDHRNPYEYYYQNNLLPSFPYPPLMLLIESVFGAVAIKSNSLILRSIMFKLPILIFDLLGGSFLMDIVHRKRTRYVIFVYFLSPIILYAAYMHGQLDIIPTSLLLGAVYYLLKTNDRQSYLKSAILFGCSLATKFHIIAAIPILFIFVWKKKSIKSAILYMLESFAVVSVFVAPFWCEGFVNTVIFNKEQTMVETVYISYGVVKLLLPIVAVVYVYSKDFLAERMDKNMLLNSLGITFSVFLSLVPAMPAWFIWAVPFLCIFIMEGKKRHRVFEFYVLFGVFFLAYYIFFHQNQWTDIIFCGNNLQWIKIANESAKDVCYSLMISVFAVLLVLMYKQGFVDNARFKHSSRPFAIGVAGDSGAGKSEMLALIDSLITKRRVLNIEGDGDHRWDRYDENWKNVTALDPQANYLYRQASNIKNLKDGKPVKRVDYDHDTGTFTDKKKILPNSYIVICGLHAFYLPQMRKVLDLTVYMDTDEELRRHWKIVRDTTLRSQSKEKVLENIKQRLPDAKKYVYPQKAYADVVICHYPDGGIMDRVNTSFEISSDIDIEELKMILKDRGIQVSTTYSSDLLRQEVRFNNYDELIQITDWGMIAEETLEQADDLLYDETEWKNGIDGLSQYMFMVALCAKMHEE